jgi:phosphatidylserine/phosphatidylglycerophosphate/cardiolipin synthase-like enzyme
MLRHFVISVLLIHTLQAKIETYFSPADHIQQKLIDRIDNKKLVSIRAALYLLFDRQVIKALMRAHQRGVRIEIIADKENFESERYRIKELLDQKTTFYIYDGDGLGIMHDKFFIFEMRDGQRITWTGSYNITRKANLHNRENVIVLDDREVARSYEREFERIKKESHRFIATQSQKQGMCIDPILSKRLAQHI